MGARPADDLDPKVAALIRHKANQIVGNYGFTKDDQDDVRQELAAYVLGAMRHHDPARSSRRTFADRIITSKIATIIQHATAQKRDRRREVALEDASVLLCQDRSAARMDLAMDVRSAIASLPGDLRRLAGLLAEHTEAEVIRATGFTRQRVRHMRQQIGLHLQALGLSPDSSE